MKIIFNRNLKINGLIIKDLLQLRNYRKTLISFILVFTAVAFLQDLSGGGTDMFRILPIMITMGFGMFSIASFNYDEIAKADRYIKSLPLSTKEIVLSKYFFSIGATIIGALIGLIMIIILSGFHIDIFESLIVSLGGILGISIVETIQIPCIYKFGAEKARMQIVIIIIAVTAILALLLGGIFYWMEKFAIDTFFIEPFVPCILILLIILIYTTSYKISYKIYAKKEF